MDHESVGAPDDSISVTLEDIDGVDLSHHSPDDNLLFFFLKLFLNHSFVILRPIFNYFFLILLTEVLFLLLFFLLQLYSIDLHADLVLARRKELILLRSGVYQLQRQ
jgi:hypothetical protein